MLWLPFSGQICLAGRCSFSTGYGLGTAGLGLGTAGLGLGTLGMGGGYGYGAGMLDPYGGASSLYSPYGMGMGTARLSGIS